MTKNDICRMSAIDMAKAIKIKKISPVEIMEGIISHIEETNPRVNAFCTLVTDSARKQAAGAEKAVMQGDKLGPLHGVPVSVKDLIFTKGIRTTGGSKIYENFIPEQDAVAVQRLKQAGAIIIGKTNTAEFGWASITDNKLFGATRNPWNLAMSPGGSSGGAAASVALCMNPLAIGTDAGGSIRIPSSFCGVFGFKPSFGRIPLYPDFPGWETISHVGPITRTVEDAALAMEIMAGRDDRDLFSLSEISQQYLPLKRDLKGLKAAWSGDLGYATADTQVLKITGAAAKTFTALGCTVEADSPKAPSPESAYSTYVGVRMAAVLKGKIEAWTDRMDAGLVRFVKRSMDKSGVEYLQAYFELLRYREEIRSFFDKYDLLLTPTVAVPPFEIGSYGHREIAGARVSPLGWMAYTYPFNITGHPAASIPCGWTDAGLPVGLQIIGKRFDDTTVLRAAAAFEQISPWYQHYPARLI